MKIMPSIPDIRKEIMGDPKLVYFAAGEQTTISWKEVPCDVADVASKPYFKVIKYKETAIFAHTMILQFSSIISLIILNCFLG